MPDNVAGVAPQTPNTKKCHYCEKDVAADAIKCPHCRFDLQDKPKNCRFCKKDVPESSSTCPYCQSDLRTWAERHPIIILSSIAILLISAFGAINSNGSAQEQQSNAVDTQSASGNAPVHVPDYQNVAISDLVKNKQIADNALVWVGGTIQKKGEINAGDLPSYAGTSYFLKISDGTSSLLVMATDTVFADYRPGDLAVLRGPIGSFGNCEAPDSDWLKNVCAETGMAEPLTREIQVDSNAIAVYQKVSLGELSNSKQLVKTSGTITQKGEYVEINEAAEKKDTSYYLKISEGGASALVEVKENEFSTFSVGDELGLTGDYIILGDCSNPEDDVVKGICEEFNMPKSGLKLITPIAPNQGEKEITIIKKSAVSGPDNVIAKSTHVSLVADPSVLSPADIAWTVCNVPPSYLKSNAQEITYGQLTKEVEKYRGKITKFTGSIMQIQQEGDHGAMILSVTNEIYGWSLKNLMYVQYNKPTQAVEDDVVTVYGILNGTYSYTTNAGNNETVPELIACPVGE
jgi:hypothetical protein